jgi:hypothetical protein
MTPLYHHTFAPWQADGTRRILADDEHWMSPIEWNRAAGEAGERRRLMVTCDLFEEFTGWMELQNGDIAGIEVAGGGMMRADMDDARMRIYSMIEATPNLDWLIISESPSKIDNIIRRCRLPELRNLWLGCLIRTQAEADERIPHLLRVPAEVRFALCEPREGLRLDRVDFKKEDVTYDSLRGTVPLGLMDLQRDGPRLSLVVCRGETGPDARPMHPNWVRSLRDQAAGASVPFAFEGWGEWGISGQCPNDGMGLNILKSLWITPEGNIIDQLFKTDMKWANCLLLGKAGSSGRLLDGKTHDGLPEVTR